MTLHLATNTGTRNGHAAIQINASSLAHRGDKGRTGQSSLRWNPYNEADYKYEYYVRTAAWGNPPDGGSTGVANSPGRLFRAETNTDARTVGAGHSSSPRTTSAPSTRTSMSLNL